MATQEKQEPTRGNGAGNIKSMSISSNAQRTDHKGDSRPPIDTAEPKPQPSRTVGKPHERARWVKTKHGHHAEATRVAFHKSWRYPRTGEGFLHEVKASTLELTRAPSRGNNHPLYSLRMHSTRYMSSGCRLQAQHVNPLRKITGLR
jgi:hypothetical protein